MNGNGYGNGLRTTRACKQTIADTIPYRIVYGMVIVKCANVLYYLMILHPTKKHNNRQIGLQFCLYNSAEFLHQTICTHPPDIFVVETLKLNNLYHTRAWQISCNGRDQYTVSQFAHANRSRKWSISRLRIL